VFFAGSTDDLRDAVVATTDVRCGKYGWLAGAEVREALMNRLSWPPIAMLPKGPLITTR
jgi:hypothetical protein